ncbi:MAG: DUF11 domain-containing protein [Spirosoma sp.]|nr:DUF11 domain-containing protein [Spirosoma sp.]
MVFQRNNANSATVLVAGLTPSTATTVEARFVPLAVGQGEVTTWTPLSFLGDTKAFRGSVTVTAGWYRLDVRAKNGSTVLDLTSVNRVGVGEVFVIAGQSNMFGGFQRVPSAAEDRVSCVDFRQDSISEQLLPLRFGHISYGSNIGPSQPPHIWGMLGDKLVQRLGVPVLFLGAALGGTSSDQWQQSAAGNIGPTQNSAVYRRLGAVLLHYVARTGARAVLWHQGESDQYTSQQTYFNNVRQVIEKSRQQAGFALPWMVSRASYIGGQTNPAVIAAQNQLIAEVPAVFPGPATDTIIGPANRPDNMHMAGEGAVRFVNTWDQQLSNTFFQNASPVLPTINGEASLITSGYTLPLTRRPGEIIVVASVRSNSQETGNQHFAQLVRNSDGTTVAESGRSTDNPILFTLPASLPNGQYQFRTVATHPALTGTLSEPFTVNAFATATTPQPVLRLTEISGTADPIIQRIGYRYEPTSHSFFGMIQATGPVEIRLEPTDGGSFSDTGWYVVPPVSQAPDYAEFADFNYVRNYPPVMLAVGGVPPGRYRLSIRKQGDSGLGVSFNGELLSYRNILYQAMEPVSGVPPVLTLTGQQPVQPCNTPVSVTFDVENGPLNFSNVYTLRLSDATGSFASEITLATGTGSPLVAQLPVSMPMGTQYRLRVVASSPAVASAPGLPFTICVGADLSLSMQSDTRTPTVDQSVAVTMTLTNSSPVAATGVQMQSLLPPNMTFLDAQSVAVSSGNGVIYIGPVNVLADASQSFVFRVKPDQPGQYVMAAQITSSSLPDPDSQPNSGTEDGQDDATQFDLRTPDAGTAVFVSPNPNQTPLPSVQSSQPPTDPAKADLSLSMAASTLTPILNQPFMLSLTVSNRGGATASNVSVITLLPTGWHLVSSAGLVINGQTITGSLSGILAGASTALVLSVQATSAGTVKAQIQAATPDDPDSTPGNGYENGEDDEVSLSVRVR